MSRFRLFSTSLLMTSIGLVLTTNAFADVTVNGDFETTDTSGWTYFPTSNSSFDAIMSPAPDVFAGTTSGRIVNDAAASAAIVKQANIGIGSIMANQEVNISFWAKGSAAAGGVQFAEFFSEVSGGGTSSSVILGGGPLFLTETWTQYNFTTTTGNDVSGGVTLQLAATTGGDAGSTSTFFVDNVSVSAVPEPFSGSLLGLGGLALLVLRRRRR